MYAHDAVIYRATVVPASEARDGETPTCVVVTKEVSGHAVWFACADGDTLHAFHHDTGHREAALEEAVEYAAKLRRMREKSKARNERA